MESAVPFPCWARTAFLPSTAMAQHNCQVGCSVAPALRSPLTGTFFSSSVLSFNVTYSPAVCGAPRITLASSHIPASLSSFPTLFATLFDDSSHDLLCTLAVFASSFLWIRVFDLLVQRKLLEKTLSRKLMHISTGILYALLWPIFSSSPYSRYFALAIPLTNVVRLLLYGLGLLKDEGVIKSISRSGSARELLCGPLYYVIVLSICTIFFWRDNPVGMVAMAIMCGGDGIADIVGRRLGVNKLPYNSNKSWVGSGSMFVCSIALSVSLLYYYTMLGFYQLNWPSAVQIVGLISLAATIVESLPVSAYFDDNMSVPLISILMGSALFPVAVL